MRNKEDDRGKSSSRLILACVTVTELDIKDKPFECVAGRTEFLYQTALRIVQTHAHTRKNILLLI